MPVPGRPRPHQVRSWALCCVSLSTALGSEQVVTVLAPSLPPGLLCFPVQADPLSASPSPLLQAAGLLAATAQASAFRCSRHPLPLHLTPALLAGTSPAVTPIGKFPGAAGQHGNRMLAVPSMSLATVPFCLHQGARLCPLCAMSPRGQGLWSLSPAHSRHPAEAQAALAGRAASRTDCSLPWDPQWPATVPRGQGSVTITPQRPILPVPGRRQVLRRNKEEEGHRFCRQSFGSHWADVAGAGEGGWAQGMGSKGVTLWVQPRGPSSPCSGFPEEQTHV